ncbi:DUF4136 domain-containing protein [Sphingomonas sp.]|uniref:DUF4136 domain-containing protein n=1 Tax=Sphingomonas sp. TaxID=28214 RepID=UPI001D1FDA14|nr:DUF4136 domain-containing protein [Sphingomonas sp.]MBX9797168.1 DUF4136 domain-containing protein [Sphingomonas sp.]
MKKVVLAVGLALAVAGCAEPFRARVARFQQLPPTAGQTFFVQSADPSVQGGLEFQQYANVLASEMVRQGYRPASDPATAQLIVRMRYRVDGGREKIVTSPGLGWGGGWGGFGPWGPGFGGRGAFVYGFNDPFLWGGWGGFGGFGGYSDVRSYTVYNSELALEIDRADNGQRVFEGNARALSRNDNLPYLVPNLIQAMFTGFPGNSGQTVNITIAPEKKRSQPAAQQAPAIGG